jgi:feruloyl esterase
MLTRLIALTTLLIACSARGHATDCAQLGQTRLKHAVVTAAEVVAAGTPLLPTDGSGGTAGPLAKADLCRIRVTAAPTTDSAIQIELWVPLGSGWNGKYEQVGNGGFAGAMPYELMTYVLSLGYAVAGTDDGHRAPYVVDASWALNHPEKIIDFGWRAIDETARTARQLLQKLTTRAPARSYFVGCSDGGREALVMAQRFPSYFDGIIAGAPAYPMTRLFTGGALLESAVTATGAHLAAPQLDLLQHLALQSCARGLPYITNPLQCHPDLETLKCADADAKHCLTGAQIDLARAIYAGRTDPATGTPIYGLQPGAEALPGSWGAWLLGGNDKVPPYGLAFSWNYLAFMVVGNPKLDLATVTTADLVRGERQIGPIIDAANPDLSAFKKHGGKLIQYHGWNDPAIAPEYSLAYRDQVAAKTRGIDEFYRLYMVPGMLHCRGGDAPTNVDWQSALEAWVEKGVAPGGLTAADGHGGTQTLQAVE